MVGPVQIEYGTIIAAGVVYRKDVFEGGRLLLSHAPIDRDRNFYPGLYWDVTRLVTNNTNYIANLITLRHWYLLVRSEFFKGDTMNQMLYEGVIEKLDMAIKERLDRFKALSQKMPESIEKYRAIMKEEASERVLRQKKAFYERWPDVEAVFERNLDDPGDPLTREPFLEEISRRVTEGGPDYITVIQSLDRAWSGKGTRWLQGIVDRIHEQALERMPSFEKR